MTGMSSGHCAQREPAVGVSRRRVESERHPISPAAKILNLGSVSGGASRRYGFEGIFPCRMEKSIRVVPRTRLFVLERERRFFYWTL